MDSASELEPGHRVSDYGRVGSGRVSGQSYIWPDQVLWPGSR